MKPSPCFLALLALCCMAASAQPSGGGNASPIPLPFRPTSDGHLALFATWAIAAGQNPAAELSKRSGLPPDEVAKLLADCNANQQSMNFCAWRDQIAAEQ